MEGEGVEGAAKLLLVNPLLYFLLILSVCLSVFLHHKETIFVESSCVLLFLCFCFVALVSAFP